MRTGHLVRFFVVTLLTPLGVFGAPSVLPPWHGYNKIGIAYTSVAGFYDNRSAIMDFSEEVLGGSVYLEYGFPKEQGIIVSGPLGLISRASFNVGNDIDRESYSIFTGVWEIAYKIRTIAKPLMAGPGLRVAFPVNEREHPSGFQIEPQVLLGRNFESRSIGTVLDLGYRFRFGPDADIVTFYHETSYHYHWKWQIKLLAFGYVCPSRTETDGRYKEIVLIDESSSEPGRTTARFDGGDPSREQDNIQAGASFSLFLNKTIDIDMAVLKTIYGRSSSDQFQVSTGVAFKIGL